MGKGNVYIVERILAKRRGKVASEYLVKWKNYSSTHNSWEPQRNILDQRLIDIFEEKSPLSAGTTRQETGEMRTRSQGVARLDSNTTPSGHLTRRKKLETQQIQVETVANPTEQQHVEETISPTPPKLVQMVSDEDLIRIKEEKSRQHNLTNNQPTKTHHRCVDIVVTDVTSHNVSVTFRENSSSEGFFH